MKKWMCGLLCACFALTLCGCGFVEGLLSGEGTGGFPSIFQKDPVLVCEPVDFGSKPQVEPNVFQEFYIWSNGKVTKKGSYYYISNEKTVDQYVEMLEENGFTLVEKDTDPYLCAYLWKLRSDRVPDAQNADGWKGAHIVIEGFTDGKFFFEVSPDLVSKDLGLRVGGGSVDIYQAGPSAGAGLYQMGDGSFETTDGRLTAKIGTATVIRDGKTLQGESHYHLNKSEWLMVNGYHRNEDFFFAVDPDYTMAGDCHWMQDFWGARYYFTDDPSSTIMDSGHGSNPYFLIRQGDDRYGPSQTGSRFETVLVRVMYYEEDVAAVYYVYAKMRTGEPSEIEALCAVDMKPQEKEASSSSSGKVNSSSSCNACSGSGRCGMCGGSGKVNRWVGDSYILQDCTGAFCSGGRCNQCGGTGKD